MKFLCIEFYLVVVMMLGTMKETKIVSCLLDMLQISVGPFCSYSCIFQANIAMSEYDIL